MLRVAQLVVGDQADGSLAVVDWWWSVRSMQPTAAIRHQHSGSTSVRRAEQLGRPVFVIRADKGSEDRYEP